MTESTGPKISSWAIGIALSTSAKTVGSTYQPVVEAVGRPPPVATRAPSVLADRDVALDPVALPLGDQRADLGRGVERVADRASTPTSRSASTTSS